jgi:hypothetical protein
VDMDSSMDSEYAVVNLRMARHLFLVFQDIDWRWSGLTLEERLIYPDQEALNDVRDWVLQTIPTQETFRTFFP